MLPLQSETNAKQLLTISVAYYRRRCQCRQQQQGRRGVETATHGVDECQSWRWRLDLDYESNEINRPPCLVESCKVGVAGVRKHPRMRKRDPEEKEKIGNVDSTPGIGTTFIQVGRDSWKFGCLILNRRPVQLSE